VETGPESFVAIECKAAERVESRVTRGIVNLAAEQGPLAVPAARVACRTEQAYPVEIADIGDARAVPVAGPSGVLDDLLRWL